MFPVQPLSIGGIVDAGVSFYGSTFKQTLRISALATLPYALISLGISVSVGALDPNADPEVAVEAATEMMAGMLAFMPLLYITLTFMIATVAHRLVALARDEETSDTKDLLFGLKLMVPLMLMMVLYILAMTLGMILLIIPGIILSVSLSLFMYVPIFEDRSAWSSLVRSHRLVWRGNWWRVAGALMIITILMMVVSGCFSLLLGGLGIAKLGSDYAAVFTLIEGLGTWAMMILVTPLSAAMALVLYNDVFIRREGDDLGSRLSALDDNTLEA